MISLRIPAAAAQTLASARPSGLSAAAWQRVTEQIGARQVVNGLPLTSPPVALNSPDDVSGFGVTASLSGDTLVVGAPGSASDVGAAYVFERNQGGADMWGLAATIAVPALPAGSQFGAGVAIDGDTVAIGVPQTEAGVVYIYERNQGGAEQWGNVLNVSGNGVHVGDRFGTAVALDGDTLVAGAPDHASGQGAAYVFARNQGGADNWGEVTPQSLVPSLTSATARFGAAVAISCDTVVVGAYQQSVGGFERGAAFVFERNQGGADAFGQVAVLSADAATFGLAVGIDGDTAIVGAPDIFGNSSGSAYIFERNQGGAEKWGEVARLTSPASGPTQFGTSVAISGDVAVVGEPLGPGAAYVFGRNQGGAELWGLSGRLADPGVGSDDLFGSSAVIDGNTVVVGAPQSGTAGTAYVFTASGGAWTQVAEREASNGASNDMLGASIGLSGDTLVVGAPGHDAQRGIAYIFERNTGGADGWGQVAELSAVDGASGDLFGSAVAISNDTVVVGAANARVTGFAVGAAYIFERNTGGAEKWGQVQRLVVNPTGASVNVGSAVAIDCDTAIVGAPTDGAEDGSAFIFERNQGGAENWGLVVSVVAPGGTFGNLYGAAVAIDRDTAVVGARAGDAAYVFTRNQGGAEAWGLVATLSAPDTVTFGASVAIDGDTAVVGAPFTSPAGAAYVFGLNQGGAQAWGLVATLTPQEDNPMSLPQFGVAVAMAGDSIVVGASQDDSDLGAAYVFARNQGGADAWGSVATLEASNGMATNAFGGAAGISANTIVIGADGVATLRGALYVFDLESPDNDGVAAEIEDAAPNGGDGNGDGIPDRVQDDVASLPAASGGVYLTLTVAGQCAAAREVAAIAAPARDPGFSYPFGLLRFTLPCTAALQLRVLVHGADDLRNFEYRNYGPIPGIDDRPQYYALPSSTTGTIDVNGRPVPSVFFLLTDGRLGDDTSAGDGMIVTSGGPAQAPRSSDDDGCAIGASAARGTLPLSFVALPLLLLLLRRLRPLRIAACRR